jgi:glucose-6-phosphate 1-dehydrogenase
LDKRCPYWGPADELRSRSEAKALAASLFQPPQDKKGEFFIESPQKIFAFLMAYGPTPEELERLLHDCMIGDQTLFQRADMVEAGWSVVNPVLDLWKALPPRNFPNYASGTWGPKEADDLLERDGRRWRTFEK